MEDLNSLRHKLADALESGDPWWNSPTSDDLPWILNVARAGRTLLPSLVGMEIADTGGATCQWDSDRQIMVCTDSLFSVKGGTMYGSVFITSNSAAYYQTPQGQAVLDHEARHRDQWAFLGADGFLLIYGADYIANGECGYVEGSAGYRDGRYVGC